MFGFSLASHLLQGPTQRTWNCVSHFATLVWSKFFEIGNNRMPRSRKRHHSHSKSRSRSRSRSPHTRDRSGERYRKDSHEKDGKRRKIDAVDSPQNRSLSPTAEARSTTTEETTKIQQIEDQPPTTTSQDVAELEEDVKSNNVKTLGTDQDKEIEKKEKSTLCEDSQDEDDKSLATNKTKQDLNGENENNDKEEILELSDSDAGSMDTSKKETTLDTPKREKLSDSAKKEKRASLGNKALTPKQLQKKAERDEKLKQKQEEKAKLLEEKLKAKQQKDEEKQKQLEEKRKQLEQKQKEKELKEEQKRKEKEEKEEQRKKEKEEKERKRKEKEELEEQKRKERELEKLKKQQEIEEKEKEKLKEVEKHQKSAKLFVNFFKKVENQPQDEKKTEKVLTTTNNFMPFVVKSDMKLPPLRRKPLTESHISNIDNLFQTQDENASYLKDLKSGNLKVGHCEKTWPVEDDPEDDDVMVVEGKDLGETISEDTSTVQKMRAKFLSFHENRRPPYFGTWRKKSKFVTPRRPFGEDMNLFNYEEDSDDDWEEEEQGESLDVSDEEADKEIEEEKDDYEVDNEFFVPHGHLSDDEINEEETARLSPESMKQKLKLLKDEFDQDMKLKTHKLKPRVIGCVWFNKAGDNVEDAIQRYLQPFAALYNGQVEIKKRSEIFHTTNAGERKKVKIIQELPANHIPLFLNIIHGNPHNQKTLVEEFMTYMVNNGMQVDVSKTNLIRYLKKSATYKKYKEPGTMKNKSGWFLNKDVREKYNITLEKSEKSE